MTTAKQLSTLLNNVDERLSTPTGINALLQHCQLLQAVTKLVRQCLPEPLTEHCQVINLIPPGRAQVPPGKVYPSGQGTGTPEGAQGGSRLLLQTDSPTWNTLLRYQIPELLVQLQRSPHLEQLKSILVRTAPAAQAGPTCHHAQPRYLSPDSAMLIMSLASSIGDPRLKASLQRLAAHNRSS